MNEITTAMDRHYQENCRETTAETSEKETTVEEKDTYFQQWIEEGEVILGNMLLFILSTCSFYA